MVECLLRHYLKKVQHLDRNDMNVIVGERFDGDSYDLLNRSGEPLYSVRCGEVESDIDRVDPDWLIVPTRTEFSRSDNLVPLRLESIKIGWCVPLNSMLHRADAIMDVDDETGARNALDAAIVGMIMDPECIQFSRFMGDRSAKNYNIEDFYDMSTAVIVLEKKELPSEMMANSVLKEESLAGLKSMLVTKAYVPYIHSEVGHTIAEQPKQDSGIELRNFSSSLHASVKAVEWLLIHAANDPTPVGTFFGLYQVLEVLMSYVFQTGVKAIWELTHGTTVNAYNLERELRRITNRENRLRYIFERFCGCTTSSALVIEEANEFLFALDADRKKATACHDAIYRVRNKVVHAQAHWRLSFNANECLQRVNVALYLLMGEVLSGFSLANGEASLKDFLKSRLKV